MMSQTILIVSPLLPATGNSTTVGRLQKHFENNDFQVSLICSHQLNQDKSKCMVKAINDTVAKVNASFMFMLHAYKSGTCTICNCKNICKLSVKYGIIFGGTDINEDTKCNDKVSVMQLCIENAKFCVAFNENLKSDALNAFPSIQTPVHVQSQGIHYNLFDLYQSCNVVNGDSTNRAKCIVFILPCGIRSVKDPIFVIDQIEELRKKLNKDIRLLIVGPVLDNKYGKIFFEKITSLSKNSTDSKNAAFAVQQSQPVPFFPISNEGGRSDYLHRWLNNHNGNAVQYLPAFTQDKLFKYLKMKLFIAVLNTSRSEGFPQALLEAMMLGVPVLGRDIPGNRAVVKDGETGFLFATPTEFFNKATVIINENDQVAKIVSSARSYVVNQHNPYDEAAFYVSLLKSHVDVQK